jgi:hypothetical protein
MLLVIVVGILNVYAFIGAHIYLSIVGILFSSFAVIVINGKITQTILKKQQYSTLQIVNNNWINYLIVVIALATPVFVINYLLRLIPLSSAEQYVFLKETAKAFMWAISIYVLPIVFLKRLGFISVVMGISYFFSAIKQSMQVMPFVLAMFVLSVGSHLWLIEKFKDNSQILNFMPALAIVNVASTYLSFIVFAAASFILVRGAKENA